MLVSIMVAGGGWAYWHARRDRCSKLVRETYDQMNSGEMTGYEWQQAVQKMEAAAQSEHDRRMIHRLVALKTFAFGQVDDRVGMTACMEELNDLLEPTFGAPKRPEEMFKDTEGLLSGKELAKYKALLPLARQEPDPSPCLDLWNEDSR